MLKKLLFLAVSLLLLAVGGTLPLKALQDARYFPETGFGVDNNVIWE